MKHAAEEVESVRKYIDALPGPVQLLMIRDSEICEECEALEQLTRKLSMLSHNFRFDVLTWPGDREEIARRGVDMAPALLIEGMAGGRIRFYGVPTFSELATLLRTIKESSDGKLDLTPSARHGFSNLIKPLSIRILVPKTVLFCPDIVAMAAKLAFAYTTVTVDVVNIGQFPELDRHYGNPFREKVLLNGVDVPFDGSSEAKFADSILRTVL